MSHTPRLALTFGSALTLAGAGVVAATPSASAAASCSSGQVCVWQDANFGGGKASWIDGDTAPAFSGMVFSNGVGLNDRVSSVYNNTNGWIWIYTDARCKGSLETIAAHTTDSQVYYNDKTSSLSTTDGSC